MKTVKEIEKITGISKQKIYREIRKNGLKPQKKINGTNYYSDNILGFFSKQNETKSDKEMIIHSFDKGDQIKDSSTFSLIKELKQEVKQLQKQLEIKDQQIDTLSRLLDQQQKLSLADKKQLENHNQENKTNSKTVSNSVSKKTDEKANIPADSGDTSIKSIFNFIFKKNRNSRDKH